MSRKQYTPISVNKIQKTQIIKRNNAQKNRDDKLLSASFNIALLLSAVALRDKFDFGNQRLERFIDAVQDSLESYNKGYVSVSDFNQMILDETGIEILDKSMLTDEQYKYRE